MSKEQRDFIIRYKLNKLFIFVIQVLIVVVFFATWQYLSSHNIINSFIFSSPSKVIDTI